MILTCITSIRIRTLLWIRSKTSFAGAVTATTAGLHACSLHFCQRRVTQPTLALVALLITTTKTHPTSVPSFLPSFLPSFRQLPLPPLFSL